MLLDHRYQVLHSLGSGGFGEAFLAEDTQMPSRRRCVIKKLHPINLDSEIYQVIRERFQREAAILEDLGKHEQIPTLYAYFEQDKSFYLVQELIEGRTLTAQIREEGCCSEAYVREFLLSLLLVIEYVHSKRIIHRDINPNNIIIRSFDKNPVLIDFGAVKELMSSTLISLGSIIPSIVIGTPGFMSSEQAAGRPIYSSDLYALGLTVIYMLTGRLPQEIETDLNTGEILWVQHCPTLSPTLIGVLKQAVAVNSSDRFVTASVMREALSQGNILSVADPRTNATIAVSPQAKFQPIKISSQSHTSAWLQTLVIAGSITTAILLGFWMLSRSNSTIKTAETPDSPTVNPEEIRYPSPPVVEPPTPSPSLTTQTVLPVLPSTPTSTPIPTPTPIPSQVQPITPPSSYISEGNAISLIETLYFLISDKQFVQAADLYSRQLAEEFDPNFFRQFDRVTVSDLYVISRTDTSINLEGINTYVWSDGSIQRELRTYTVHQVGNDVKITASEFVRVMQFRQ